MTDRYCTGTIDNYPSVPISLWVNPTGDELTLLQSNGYTQAVFDCLPAVRKAGQAVTAAETALEQAETDADRGAAQTALDTARAEQDAAQAAHDAALAQGKTERDAILVRFFGGKAYAVGDYTLDFSTPKAARATMENEALPIDIQAWIAFAPQAAIDFDRERIRANLKKSLKIGT